MVVDLLERVSQMKEQEYQESAEAHGILGWKEKYIIKPGETPWWRVNDPKERNLLCSRQHLRMRHKNNPRYGADAMKRYRERHPKPKRPRPLTARDYLLSGSSEESLINEGYGLYLVLNYAWKLEKAGLRQRPRDSDGKLSYAEGLNVEGRKQYEARTTQRRNYTRKNSVITHGTPGKRGKVHTVPNKRPRREDGSCELCNKIPRAISYHHWDDDDFSKGLYLCRNWCHVLADFIDKDPDIVTKYLKLKADLDDLFSSSLVLFLAKRDWDAEWDKIGAEFNEHAFGKHYARYFQRRHYLGVSVNGRLSYFLKIENKRPHPGGNNLLGPCELCGKLSKKLNYHHWGENPNKGLWLCARCHVFAEVVDATPQAERKYVFLKTQIKEELEEVPVGT